MKIKNKVSQWKFWRVPHLDNLELLSGSNITHFYPPHMHEEYCVLLMLKGTETNTYQGMSYTAFPGDLALLNPEEVHSSESIGAVYRIIRIRPTSLSRLETEIFGRQSGTPYFSKPIIKDTLLFRLLLNLHLKLERQVSPLEQKSEFITSFGRLLARQVKAHPTPKTKGSEPHYVKLVRDYLRSHYTENISLAQLTAITNLSPFYLLRVFHAQVGFPPHEYQTQVRIAQARKLLLEGKSISQAALETGFFDQSHLSRNFKRIVGLTPGQYSSQSNNVQDSAG
jgi:AraC-like DNA-binding protein